jgi:hypothetical protein
MGQMKVILPLAVLFLINLALFSLPGVPGSQPKILALAEDLQIPDMMGIYSPDDVYTFLDSVGGTGRTSYQTMHYATDLAFPLVYGALLFALLCRAIDKTGTNFRWLPFIAFLPTLADLAENFTLVTITARFPEFLPGLTHLAQVFTLFKFGGIGLCLVINIVLRVKTPGINQVP